MQRHRGVAPVGGRQVEGVGARVGNDGVGNVERVVGRQRIVQHSLKRGQHGERQVVDVHRVGVEQLAFQVVGAARGQLAVGVVEGPPMVGGEDADGVGARQCVARVGVEGHADGVGVAVGGAVAQAIEDGHKGAAVNLQVVRADADGGMVGLYLGVPIGREGAAERKQLSVEAQAACTQRVAEDGEVVVLVVDILLCREPGLAHAVLHRGHRHRGGAAAEATRAVAAHQQRYSGAAREVVGLRSDVAGKGRLLVGDNFAARHGVGVRVLVVHPVAVVARGDMGVVVLLLAHAAQQVGVPPLAEGDGLLVEVRAAIVVGDGHMGRAVALKHGEGAPVGGDGLAAEVAPGVERVAQWLLGAEDVGLAALQGDVQQAVVGYLDVAGHLPVAEPIVEVDGDDGAVLGGQEAQHLGVALGSGGRLGDVLGAEAAGGDDHGHLVADEDGVAGKEGDVGRGGDVVGTASHLLVGAADVHRLAAAVEVEGGCMVLAFNGDGGIGRAYGNQRAGVVGQLVRAACVGQEHHPEVAPHVGGGGRLRAGSPSRQEQQQDDMAQLFHAPKDCSTE